ncbi:MAG: 2-hydroxychromene-2-carboxylate isomerase [Alphaproteobacteria bacterium]
MARRIDYYLSLLSPFTYLAGHRLEDIASRHGCRIDYKPVDIVRVFAETGGVPLPKRAPERRAYRLIDMARVARRQGMPINLEPMHFPTDAAPASQLVIAAQEAGQDVSDLTSGFLRAVWAEERNVADPATIREVAEENGIDYSKLEDAAREAGETYAANTSEAIACGVFGMPSYVYRNEVFWGQDRLDYLDDALEAS